MIFSGFLLAHKGIWSLLVYKYCMVRIVSKIAKSKRVEIRADGSHRNSRER